MRYALYFTPAPDTGLWRFGSGVLGYDSATREAAAFPVHALWHEPWFERAQETPARYGFHATLKAPFALAPGISEDVLLERAASFSAGRDFVALRPLAEDAELNRLAAACVRDFDDLRAPLSAEDRARRLASALKPRQHRHLEDWGYPYVFEDFRFHMTLTGALPKSLQPRALEVLRTLYYRISGPVWIDAITVLAQPTRDSRFAVVERFALRAYAPAIDLGL